MHDIDRTIQEVEDFFREEDFEETGFEEEFTSQFEFASQYEESGFYTEEDELSLASELLTISSDRELDMFLGKLFKKIKDSGVLKKVGGVFKKIAKTALPIAGKAVGTFFGGPAGAAIGGSLGKAASNMFEIDMEGLRPEEQDFEVAKKFVRFANATSNALAKIPAGRASDTAVKQIIKNTAKTHAPGLFKNPLPTQYSSVGGQSGRWARRGNKIILFGVV